MSRPPPIPYDDESPRRRPPPVPSNSNENNVARRRTGDSPPPPPRPPAPPRAEVGSPPQPTRDMSAFFRQWGASSPGGGTEEVNSFSVMGGSARGWSSSGTGIGYEYDVPLQIDRSASFDEDPRGPAHGLQAQHRRIASTGATAVISGMDLSHLMMPQSPGAPLLDIDGDGTGVDALGGHGLSALHDAARITDWPAVAALSESEPESARYVGPDGWNALHHACDRRCPYVDVIDSLLSAYPEALVQTNDKGWTPLHRACRNKTPRDVVKLLLRKYPELGKRAAGMRCNDGRSALHYALLYDAPEGVVDLLLQADPGAVLDEDRDGMSPLGTIWDKYANSFEGRRMLQILLRPFEGEGWELGAGAPGDNVNAEEGKQEGESSEAAGTQPRQRSDKEIAEGRVREAMKKASPACKSLQANWQKANTLLRAYFRFPLQEEKTTDAEDSKLSGSPPRGSPINMPRKRKWRILHATSAIKCHPKLFLVARALHPEQALEIDENDLYPSGRGGDIAISSLPDPQSTTLSNRTALHFAAMSQLDGKEGRNVIKVLLKLNPHAAQHVDGNGSLPLHLICQNVRKLKHWTNCGPKDICQVYPAATSCRDGAGRTPLHCVASAAGQYTYESPATGARLAGPTYGPTGISPALLEASVVLHLVDTNRACASVADNTGRLPLHYIAERCEEWTPDAQGILDAHPAAVSARAGPSAANQLPLHMAAGSPDARPSLIMELVSANPRAASLSDGTGRLPLHLAVDSGRTSWDRGIGAIYGAYQRAISMAEEGPRRWTVLHTAAASPSAGFGLIQKIIELDVNNTTASMADGRGRFPLHLACASNRSWEDGCVRDIFNADPSVALSEDAGGLLPFHIAAMRSNCSLSTASNTSVESEGSNHSDNGEDVDDEDLDTLEVVFNLLIAQPSVVQV